MKRRAASRRGAAAAQADASEPEPADEPMPLANSEIGEEAVPKENGAGATDDGASAPRGGRVSNERAMYFARGEAPPASASAAARRRRGGTGAGSTASSSASTSAAAGGVEAHESSWPGYFETARALGEQRQAAQAARQEALERAAAGTTDMDDNGIEKAVWVPSKKPRKSIRTPDRVVPRLQELALQCIAQHINVMPTLEYVDATTRHRVAQSVVKLRLMKPEVLPLFVFPGVTEIDLSDCSGIDETSLISALQHCAAEGLTLTILRLGLCGRCVSDSVIVELGDSLRSVELLAMNGCYRVSDTGIEALVRRCAPSLQEFEFSCNQRITSVSIQYVGELEHLRALSLSECPQLDDRALQALLNMQKLRKLELNQMERISDEFIAELTSKLPDLEELSLARCAQLSDAGVCAALENCRKLRILDLSDLHELTDDSFEPIHRLGHALRVVTIRRCLGLTDVAIEYLAFGANSYLERLEMSSVTEVTDAAITALQKHCAESLTALDISFCRNVTEDCLGIFTDSAEKLELLVLWGCTQITARFLTCQSRDDLLITGHPLLTGLTIKY